MEKELQKFLNDAFAPYGDFPARADVIQELLANLLEKYNDLKQQGKSDNQAYRMTIDSFGDVSEIMAQVPHANRPTRNDKPEASLYKTLISGVKGAAGNKPTAMASNLSQADLSDTDLAGKDFSMSALVEATFDGANLRDTKFKAAALNGASFIGVNLTDAQFSSSDLQSANFTKADLTNVVITGSALKGVNFTDATLVDTEFVGCDMSGISFDGLSLNGVIFNKSSLKNATFRQARLHNVSFHHTAVKHTVFDGAAMDKLTYALLKGAKATLTDVTIE